jgi:hypothetical protein
LTKRPVPIEDPKFIHILSFYQVSKSLSNNLQKMHQTIYFSLKTRPQKIPFFSEEPKKARKNLSFASLFGRRKDSSKQKAPIAPSIESSTAIEELPKQQPLIADEVVVVEEVTPTVEQPAAVEELVKTEEELPKVEGQFLVRGSIPRESF